MIQGAYQIKSIEKIEDTLNVQVLWNQDNEIFAAHFPGQPVVPGALMLHVVTEIVSKEKESPMFLTASRRIKFLKVIDPFKDPIVRIVAKLKEVEDQIVADVVIYKEENVFFKFKGKFKAC